MNQQWRRVAKHHRTWTRQMASQVIGLGWTPENRTSMYWMLPIRKPANQSMVLLRPELPIDLFDCRLMVSLT